MNFEGCTLKNSAAASRRSHCRRRSRFDLSCKIFSGCCNASRSRAPYIGVCVQDALNRYRAGLAPVARMNSQATSRWTADGRAVGLGRSPCLRDPDGPTRSKEQHRLSCVADAYRRMAEPHATTVTTFVVSTVQDAAGKTSQQAEVATMAAQEQECSTHALRSPRDRMTMMRRLREQ